MNCFLHLTEQNNSKWYFFSLFSTDSFVSSKSECTCSSSRSHSM